MQIVIAASSGFVTALLTVAMLDGLIRHKEKTLREHPLRAVLSVFPFAVLAADMWLPLAPLSNALRVAAAAVFLMIVVAVVAAWKETKKTLWTQIVWTALCGVAGFGAGWLIYRACL